MRYISFSRSFSLTKLNEFKEEIVSSGFTCHTILGIPLGDPCSLFVNVKIIIISVPINIKIKVKVYKILHLLYNRIIIYTLNLISLYNHRWKPHTIILLKFYCRCTMNVSSKIFLPIM